MIGMLRLKGSKDDNTIYASKDKTVLLLAALLITLSREDKSSDLPVLVPDHTFRTKSQTTPIECVPGRQLCDVVMAHIFRNPDRI